MAKKGKRRRDAAREADRPAPVDRAAEGLHTSGPPPYGLRVNEIGEWELVPAEVEIVREIFRLRRDQGTPYQRIADLLNERGVPTPKGKPGSRWSGATIMRIEKNPIYNPSPPDPADLPDAWAAMRAARAYSVTGTILADER